MKLYAGRWSTDGATMQADSAMLEPENVGVNWRLDTFGLQRIEVLVKARNKYDQYARYRDHLGQRLALYDSACYRPISGYITDIEYAGAGRVLYTAKGPGSCRMEDERDTTAYNGSTSLSSVLSTLLTDHVSVSSSDHSNIDTNSRGISAAFGNGIDGVSPKALVETILNSSDASNNIWDFWFVDEPFSGVSLQKYLPYYQARTTTAASDWVVYSRDLSRSSVARDISSIVTNARIYPGLGARTATGGSATTAVVAGVSFATDGLTPGDRIYNRTDGSTGTVVSVSGGTATVGSWTGGSTNICGSGDALEYTLQNGNLSATATGTSDYWDREVVERVSRLSAGYAPSYAETYISTDPRQVQSFTVGAPRIRTGNGARVPLWQVIAQGGGYIRWADMYPAAALFSTSADGLTTFRITGLDYDYRNNQLAVTVDQPSARLDARLRRAGILGSDLIQRA